MYNLHTRLMEPFGSFTPKNPAFDATWLDETLNRDLKSCCKFVSQGNFESAVPLQMCDILSPKGSAKRRRTG